MIVSFFSFKGGVGRTTALAATAIQLARAGKRVVVIDFDVESPGIGTLFHSSTGGNARCGVVDYLLEKSVLQGRLEIQDYYHLCDDPKIIQDGTEIAVVPAGVVDDMYLEKLARVNYEFLYRTAEVASGDVSPLHQLLKQLRNSCRPDFVLIDSRAGFHDLGGLSLSGLAHWHVILGLPSEQSWQGLAVAIAQLGRHRVLAGLMQRECLVVQAMGAPSGEFRERQVREFRERSFDLFAENYFDPQQSDSSEWPVPDPESIDSPHFPAVISWDSRVAGYSHLADVADFLCEGEYRRLVATLLERSGRSNT
ncbi:MAG: ParA family protein [Planctomycetota bacterium]|nr:ParA family protein [Planctomycetota bacterium]